MSQLYSPFKYSYNPKHIMENNKKRADQKLAQ